MSIKLANDFWSYSETCNRIKSFGVIPEEKPSNDMIRRLRYIVDRCMEHYSPASDDYILRGVYLYREQDQAGDLRQTYGYTQDVGNHEALIGLSYGLIEYRDMPVFHDLVFIHELAHLTKLEHNDRFQDRFNDLEFDYYFYRRIRTDGKGPRKLNRHGWKM